MEKIAIVGMACQFAEARNYEEFWEILKSGKDCIKEVTNERWPATFYTTNIKDKNASHSKWCGTIQDYSSFDHGFFGISPKEAKAMDPQQRLLLQETYHAIEDSCESVSFFQEKKTAVFVANMAIDYQENACLATQQIEAYSASGTFECMLANRLSYYFDFNGRSEVVNAACASSLVALHNARLALENEECDIAIVGAVNLNINPFKYISFGKARMLSPDGKCKPFDYKANGYVPGDGVAVIILEKQKEAIKNKHRIHAIIEGSQTRHNGKTLSLTAPRIASQADLLEKTWKTSGIDINQLSYIEAHGTGTSLGDPIEIEGIKTAFKQFKHDGNNCYVGSVKSNIGHLEASAGLAGIIKVVMMMKHKLIAPTINLEHLNPIINLKDSHLKIVDKLQKWSTYKEMPFMAGVSSFGFGGVNAHVVVSSYKNEENSAINNNKNIPFVLSAKSKKSLEILKKEWIKYLTNTSEITNSIYSELRKKSNLNYKFACTYNAKEELLENLQNGEIEKTKEITSLWIGEDIASSTILFLKEKSIRFQELLDTYNKSIILPEALPQTKREQIEHLINLYALGLCISEECTHFEKIGGNGIGKYVALILSGIYDIQTVINYIISGELKGKINLEIRYNLIGFDQELHPDFLPIYLKKLREIKNNEENWFVSFREHYKLLINTQFTFRKNILEWREACDDLALNFEDVFSNNKLKLEGLTTIQKKLVEVVIICAWKKLNKKWEITTLEISEVWVNEISELVLRKVITKKDVITILLHKELSKTTRENFNIFCTQLKEKDQRELPILTHQVIDTLDITQVISYLKSKQELPENSVIIGTCNVEEPVSYHFNPKEKIEREWIQLWIALWKSGNPIDFIKQFELKGKIETIPQYPFEKNNFFTSIFNEKDLQKREVIENNNIEEDIVRQEVKVWEEGTTIISDHTISNNILIPGALLTSQAIEIVTQNIVKAVEGSVQFLRPAFVSGKLNTDFTFEKHHFQWKDSTNVLCKGKLYSITKEPKEKKREQEEGVTITISPYPLLQQMGYDFGPSLQTIKRIQKSKGKYRVNIQASIINSNQINPYVLDGILQAGLLTGSYEVEGIKKRNINNEELLVPFYIKKFSFYKELPAVIDVDITNFKYFKSGLEVDAKIYHKDELIAVLTGIGYSWINTRAWNTNPVKRNNLEILEYDIKIFIPEKEEVSLEKIETLLIKEAYCLVRSINELNEIIPSLCDIYKNVNLFINDELHAQLNQEWFDKKGIRLIIINWDTANEEQLKTIFKREIEKDTIEKHFYMPVLTEEKSTIDNAVQKYIYHFFEVLKGLSRLRNIPLIRFFVPIIKNKESDKNPIYGIVQGYNGLAKALEEERSKIALVPIVLDKKFIKEGITYLKHSKTLKADQKLPLQLEKSKLYQQKWKEITLTEKNNVISLDDTVLVIGGMGGVGFEIVKHLVTKKKTNVIITGRRQLTEGIQTQINELEAETRVDYKTLDSCNEDEVVSFFKELTITNNIQGIIYCAGTTADSLLSFKNKEQIEKVVTPKIKGLLNIDQYSKDLSLEFFVVLSSIVSIIGNKGQTDYALANGFIDTFSSYRKALKRSGNTLTINLGLVGTGMGDQEIVLKQFEQRNIYPINPKILPSYIEKALSLGNEQIIISSKSPFPAQSNYYSKPAKKHIKQSDMNVTIAIQVKETIQNAISETLEIETALLDEDIEFSELGVDSIAIMDIIDKMAEKFDDALDHSYLIEYPTIKALTEVLIPLWLSDVKSIVQNEEQKEKLVEETINEIREEQQEERTRISNDNVTGRIAVIGMACKFPGATSLKAFEENLKNGISSISEYPIDRIGTEAYKQTFHSEDSNVYISKAGIIDGVEYFDNTHFNLGVNPEEVDPQQRVFIETTQDLFRNMGYENEEVNGKNIALYIGGHESDYYKKKHKEKKYIGRNGVTNVIPNMIAARVSHYFNLKGTAEMIYTACSSSLVAIKNAYNALLAGEAEIAIAGGIELLLDEEWFNGFCESGVLAKDGKCKAFDVDADGFVLGEGVGVVALKRYEDAVRDGDQIQAVIKGVGANNDGQTLGLTTPNRKSQEELIHQVLEKSKITPDTIGYYEAHGTGTQLGDPIEIKSVSNVYRKHTATKNYCGLGSVKTNIGHLLSAAGIASFIKTVLSIKSGYIYPTLNCNTTNPKFDIEESPFFVTDQYQPWKTSSPRRAGISSFGFGGTNCHVVLEEFVTTRAYQQIRKPLEAILYNKTFYPLLDTQKEDIDAIEELLTALVKGKYNIKELTKKLTN